MSRERTTGDVERQGAGTALQALGIVGVYLAIVVALMYPLAQAAGYLL
jgi:hypothetical protein